MLFFDRFKKKTASDSSASPWPQPPKADTMCLLLLDRMLDDIESAVALLKADFGEQAVGEIDCSHPHVHTFTVTLDGLEFWCSYLAMPVPADTLDVATVAQYSLLLSQEEKEASINHKSFLMLAQKGAGISLEEKRRVCWTFSRLCASLLGMEGAVGVHAVGTGGLLIGKAHYFQQLQMMENKNPNNEEGYFPVPLWVWVYGYYQEKTFILRTAGLQDFGLPELGFYNPTKLDAKELWDYLFSMSCLQITGRQLYRNAALIPLDSKTEVVCKQDGDILFFIGA